MRLVGVSANLRQALLGLWEESTRIPPLESTLSSTRQKSTLASISKSLITLPRGLFLLALSALLLQTRGCFRPL